MPLPPDYLRDLEQQARRFSGAYTGTSGTLAAGVLHLLKEIRRMQADEEIGNNTTTFSSDWILRGQAELERTRHLGDGVLAAQPDMGTLDVPDDADQPEAERLLTKALEVVRNRRPLYGGPREHFKRTVGMINAAFASILNRPLTEADWALFMVLDKVSRYLGPTKTSDQITDLAGYAACLAECEQG